VRILSTAWDVSGSIGDRRSFGAGRTQARTWWRSFPVKIGISPCNMAKAMALAFFFFFCGASGVDKFEGLCFICIDLNNEPVEKS
jgi:hypothetical protein